MDLGVDTVNLDRRAAPTESLKQSPVKFGEPARDTEGAGACATTTSPRRNSNDKWQSAISEWRFTPKKVVIRALVSAVVGISVGLLDGPVVGVTFFVAAFLIFTRTRPAVPLRLALLLFPVMAVLDVSHELSLLDGVASYAFMLLVVSLALFWLDRQAQLPGVSTSASVGVVRRHFGTCSPTQIDARNGAPSRGSDD